MSLCRVLGVVSGVVVGHLLSSLSGSPPAAADSGQPSREMRSGTIVAVQAPDNNMDRYCIVVFENAVSQVTASRRRFILEVTFTAPLDDPVVLEVKRIPSWNYSAANGASIPLSDLGDVTEWPLVEVLASTGDQSTGVDMSSLMPVAVGIPSPFICLFVHAVSATDAESESPLLEAASLELRVFK